MWGEDAATIVERGRLFADCRVDADTAETALLLSCRRVGRVRNRWWGE